MTTNSYRCGDCFMENKEGIFDSFKAMQEHRKKTGHAKHVYDYWRIDCSYWQEN